MQEISLFIQNHPGLCLALALVAALIAIFEYIRLRQQTTHLNPATAVLLINRENAVVFDIRSHEAWRAGHITDAISLPWSNLKENEKKITKFSKKPVIVTDSTGKEAPKAAAYLQQKGLDARVLSGGMQAWLAAGLPTIRG